MLSKYGGRMRWYVRTGFQLTWNGLMAATFGRMRARTHRARRKSRRVRRVELRSATNRTPDFGHEVILSIFITYCSQYPPPLLFN